MPVLVVGKALNIILYFVLDLGLRTMARLEGVEGVGLMEAPLQGLDHQDPLMEGEVVVAADSQGVMAVVFPLNVLLGHTEFP